MQVSERKDNDDDEMMTKRRKRGLGEEGGTWQ